VLNPLRSEADAFRAVIYVAIAAAVIIVIVLIVQALA
jgi:hypothetical protein